MCLYEINKIINLDIKCDELVTKREYNILNNFEGLIMIVSNTVTQVNTYAQQSTTTKKEQSSNFEKELEHKDNIEAQKAKTEEIQFKKIDRMSYNFIKNLDIKKIDEIYSDLSEDEVNKLANLHHISNMSDNEVLNKTLFEEAKKMSPKEAGSFYFQKASEQYHYKTTGTGQRFVVNSNMFSQGTDGKFELNENMKKLIPSEYKLSHNEAFNMLLNMINSSEEGIENAKTDEVRKQFEEVKYEYTDILNKYNQQIRINMNTPNIHA
ncbi:hypothetical protein CRV05_02465 [Halarcobacter bivalviorum]|uniref:Uncharacterized protein n=2 Tax=Halarcobacter bivalviorum TaxID=663364 RepID=A0AAX2ACN9_9BACT|nr:hypothetical protein ABIV_1140 [Halarcobacter bivalviorum]RXK11251.1 hypothetical protein CRV05_02465 [Halarcobacter bivalviorum]